MGGDNDDDVSEDDYDPGEDDSDDEAERFILDVNKEGENQ